VAKERDFVRAARGFGATNGYLLRRHILPQTSSVLLTQAAILIPQYVLAEMTLSFLGLGVPEPVPSWRKPSLKLQQYSVAGLLLVDVFACPDHSAVLSRIPRARELIAGAARGVQDTIQRSSLRSLT